MSIGVGIAFTETLRLNTAPYRGGHRSARLLRFSRPALVGSTIQSSGKRACHSSTHRCPPSHSFSHRRGKGDETWPSAIAPASTSVNLGDVYRTAELPASDRYKWRRR